MTNVKTTCLYMRTRKGRKQYILDVHEFIGGARMETHYFNNKREVRAYVKEHGYGQWNWI